MYNRNSSKVYSYNPNGKKENILITNGRILDPKTETDTIGDLAISNGVIIACGIAPKDFVADRTIDATNRWVTPGLLDLHVHLREPGREDKETIDTGTAAAAAGGFTGVACMPNTNPVSDTEAKIRYIKQRSEKSPCRVYPIGAMTKGTAGEELAPYAEMIEAGAKAISDDGKSIYRSSMLKNALNYAKMFDIPVFCHCEDADLAKGAMNESAISTYMGMRGTPTIAEDIDVARHIMIAEYTNTPIHICHVSSAGALDQIRMAKQRGVKVTAESAPHYFSYIDADVGYNTSRKMNPPLRGEKDRQAILDALVDGTIDVIASDHAPHTFEDKDGEFDLAAFGVVGLETMVAASITKLVKTKLLSPLQLIEKMTTTPHKILKTEGGTLSEGVMADITIIDPQKEWSVESKNFYSKGKHSAFEEATLFGEAVTTILGGQVVFERV